MNNKNAFLVLKELRDNSKEMVPTITISEAMKIVRTHGFKRPTGTGSLAVTKLNQAHRNILKAWAYYDGELTKRQILKKLHQLGFKYDINTIHPRVSELVGLKILKMRAHKPISTDDGFRNQKNNFYELDREVLKNF